MKTKPSLQRVAAFALLFTTTLQPSTLLAQDSLTPPGALAQFDELQRINPQSHRAFQQWGLLRALFATGDASLATASRTNPKDVGG